MNRTRVYKGSYSRRWNSRMKHLLMKFQSSCKTSSSSSSVASISKKIWKEPAFYQSARQNRSEGLPKMAEMLPESCTVLNAKIVYRLRRWRPCTWYACSCPVIEPHPGRTSNCHCSQITEQAATRQRKVTLNYCNSTGYRYSDIDWNISWINGFSTYVSWYFFVENVELHWLGIDIVFRLNWETCMDYLKKWRWLLNLHLEKKSLLPR